MLSNPAFVRILIKLQRTGTKITSISTSSYSLLHCYICVSNLKPCAIQPCALHLMQGNLMFGNKLLLFGHYYMLFHVHHCRSQTDNCLTPTVRTRVETFDDWHVKLIKYKKGSHSVQRSDCIFLWWDWSDDPITVMYIITSTECIWWRRTDKNDQSHWEWETITYLALK